MKRCLTGVFRAVLLHWRPTVKIIFCIAVLLYLLWTYWRNVTLLFSFVTESKYRECVYRRRNYELQKSTTPLYITLAFHGRLGNWMYSYASLLGIAKANGYIPYLLSRHPLNHYLQLSNIQSHDAECLHKVTDDLPCTYNPDFMNLPQGNISVDGYVQSWKYFRFMNEEIRKEFVFKPHIMDEVKRSFHNLVGAYIKSEHLIISVHVRRGDVLKPEARKLGFCHAPQSYFDAAMKYMVEKFPKSVFLVSSDDIEWCKKHLTPPKVRRFVKGPKGSRHEDVEVPMVFSIGNSMLTDFGILTLCNHSIISVGTFGWWGAWLANGHVVYYKGFPLPGTKVDYETKKEDFFPEHWVAMSRASLVYFSSFYYLSMFVTLPLVFRIAIDMLCPAY